jgi:hypothetical protein
LNSLDDEMRAYYNLSQPALDLIEKTAGGTRVRRKRDNGRLIEEASAPTRADCAAACGAIR